MRPSLKSNLRFFLIFSFFIFLLACAVYYRINHTYLEDDLMWFLPCMGELFAGHSPIELFKIFHSEELTLIDGLYFSLLMGILKEHLDFYPWVSFVIHIFNMLFLHNLLKKRIRVGKETSLFSSLIYLGFLGQAHAYVWPLAAHHLLVVFFVLLLTNFYLKADECFEQQKDFLKWYWLTILFSMAAVVQRPSILIFPALLLTHMAGTSSDPQKLVKKYSLWAPLIFLFLLYQEFVLIFGKPGNVLSEVLKPFQGLLSSGSPGIIFSLSVFLTLSFLMSIYVFLLLYLRKNQSKIFFVSKMFSCLILIFSSAFSLAFYIFLFPADAISSLDVTQRWDIFSLPMGGWRVETSRFLSLGMLIVFLIFTFRKNKHLILFIPWYLFLIPYLHERELAIPSRYFIYLSPFLAVVVGVFFGKILPAVVPKIMGSFVKRLMFLVLSILVLTNIFFVKIMLHKTLLVDYHWTYDYVRLAQLLRADLKKYSRENTPVSSVCLQGASEVPYLDGWKGMLQRDYVWEDWAVLRWTLWAGVKKPINIFVNETCPDNAVFYRSDGIQWKNLHGQPLDPFYQHFEAGLKAMESKDLSKAFHHFENAASQRPFLINFVLGTGFMERLLEKKLLPEVSKAVVHLYLEYYDGDEKINMIDSLIYAEARDYAASLALKSYLSQVLGRPLDVIELLSKAALFVSFEDLADEFEEREGFQNFVKFLNEKRNTFDKSREISLVNIEHFKGYQMISARNHYFVLPESEGNFNLIKFKMRRYAKAFSVENTKLFEARLKILAEGENRHLNIPIVKEMLEYRSFKLAGFQDRYYVFADDSFDSTKDILFKARSIPEAKRVIDMFLELR